MFSPQDQNYSYLRSSSINGGSVWGGERTEAPITKFEFNILRCCKHGESVKTIRGYLEKYFKEESRYAPRPTEGAILRKIYRTINNLETRGLLARANPSTKPIIFLTTALALDLFGPAQNSNSVKLGPNKSRAKAVVRNISVRCSPERKEAIDKVLGVKMLNPEKKAEVDYDFENYLDRIKDSCIVLKKNRDEVFYERDTLGHSYLRVINQNIPAYLVLSYKTRFNNDESYKKNIFTYHEIWRKANQFKKAVHLTLTTDPKRFKSLWMANRNFSIAFNQFMTYLTKKLKLVSRPPYLAVYEFTKTGLLHVHLIIFRLGYLLPKGLITQEWERCNQGSITYIYSLTNNNGIWGYTRKKPKELKEGQTPENYLMKYLHKSHFDEGALSLYWLFNKRAFTYSKKLFSREPNFKTHNRGIYKFLFVCYEWDLPDLLIEADIFYAVDHG